MPAKRIKQKKSVGDMISAISQTIGGEGTTGYVPDIVEFCESDKYLGLNSGHNPINPYPLQMIVLKTFYRGSRGNENLTLTKKEIEICENIGLNDRDLDSDDSKGNLLGKLNNDKIFRELVLVWGRRCVSEDTEIVDPSTGYPWTFGELWDAGRRFIDSWTFNEKNHKMEIVPRAEIIYQGVREVFLLKTFSGHKIEVTNNHPFLTQRGWVQLKDININEDRVAISDSIPFFGNSDAISEDEAIILGYMTADGCCSQNSTFFTNNNAEIINDFGNRLNSISDNLKIFNDPWTGARSKEYQYKITSVKLKNENFRKDGVTKTLSRRKKNDLVQLLIKHDLMGKTCHHKCVPDALWDCPKNVVASYLRALFSCDGGMHIMKGGRVLFNFTTVNYNQAKSVVSLLSKFGILARLRKKKVNSSIIDEKNKKRIYNTFCYIVEFSRKKFIIKYLENIGFIGKDEEVNKMWDSLSRISDKSTSFTLGDCATLEKVRSIEHIGEKRTYDLQVSHNPQLQNFVCSSYIIHNSGKDFIASIIALYEAMKLLEIPSGDPYEYYKISSGQPIIILTVASSEDQAEVAFNEIREKLLYSSYFQDKFTPDGLETQSIYLLTPKDKQDNEAFAKKSMSNKKGSLIIRVGHSNSSSLVGKGCMVLIMDEVASYKHGTGGSGSGEKLYTLLTPMINTYFTKTKKLDENGNQVIDVAGNPEYDIVYDGKVISISSPRGKEGKLYELFSTAENVPNRLMTRLPTWEVNPYHTRESLRESQSVMNEEEFEMEFGAHFSGTAGESMFARDAVLACFKNNMKMKSIGQPGIVYFAQLDPATNSHNYALVLLHREPFLNKEENKTGFRIVVDLVKYWQPTPGKLIQVDEIDEFVISLKRKFFLGMVGYDMWNSAQSINKLRKNGIKAVMKAYNRKYKMQIYSELEELIKSGRLIISADCVLLRDEMVCLQRRYDNNGFRVFPTRDGDVCKTDDVVDALAGACFLSLQSDTERLPHGRVVDLGIGSQNNQVWQSMQGVPYGTGSGQQVADQLEKRNSWPQYKR